MSGLRRDHLADELRIFRSDLLELAGLGERGDGSVQLLLERLQRAKIDVSDTLLWWVAVGYDSPHLIAEAMKNAGPGPEQVVRYLNTLKAYPGVYGDISFTPERHDGYPDEEIIMVEANSLKNGAFKLAPGYGA